MGVLGMGGLFFRAKESALHAFTGTRSSSDYPASMES